MAPSQAVDIISRFPSTRIGASGEVQTRDPAMKSFVVLRAIVDSDVEEWSARRLAAELGMSSTTVHRALQLLVAAGFVVQDDERLTYRLGEELHRVARRVADRFPLPELAAPHLAEVARRTGETTLLGLFDATRGEMMFVSEAPGSYPLRYVIPLDSWVPVTSGASGLSILAWLDPDQIDEICKRGPGLSGEQSLANIHAELAEIRERGYAFSRSRRIPGAVGVAAAIFGSNRQVRGTVIVTTPELRFESEMEEAFASLVRDCAQRISSELGAQ